MPKNQLAIIEQIKNECPTIDELKVSTAVFKANDLVGFHDNLKKQVLTSVLIAILIHVWAKAKLMATTAAGEEAAAVPETAA